VSKLNVVQFKSWSQTRLNDYDQCPLKAKLKHLDKLCPLCFKGKVKGGYDSPALCDTCGEEIVKGAALVRGSEVGKTLEEYVNGTAKKLHPEIKHPTVLALAKELRAGFNKAKVVVEKMWNFDRNWKLLPPKWSPNVWLIVKTDVFRTVTAKSGRVIDWKTGGVEKKGPYIGKPKENKGYDEQLQIYSTAALCAFPQMESMTSALCFVDADKKYDPVIEKKSGYICRDDLAKNKKMLENRVKGMFMDTTFAPRANGLCNFCEFQKGRGGPCPY
jgi:hypothetical protein